MPFVTIEANMMLRIRVFHGEDENVSKVARALNNSKTSFTAHRKRENRKMKKIIYMAVVLTMVLAMVMGAGCGPQEAKKPPDEVTVQLKWIHQAQFAGFYAADQKGFYAEENIDITLSPGGPGILLGKDVADLISGKTTFTIRGAEEIIAARSEGNPIVAIAVLFQINPVVYTSLKSSGIKQPQDFVGEKLSVSSQQKIQHQALLKRLGIDPETIELIPYERDVTPLITGQIDAHMVYRTGLGLAFDEAGYELNFIWMDDYGIRFYADTIIASEQLVEQDPELVERFLKATLKGWRYSIENPDEAVDITLKYDATLGKDRQARMMTTQTPLIHIGEAQIGWMEDSVWKQMHQMLLDGGILAQPINIDEAYTMQFLNKIYGKAE